MQTIPFSEFKLLSASRLRKLKSFKVTADGELLLIAVIPQGEPMIRSTVITQVDEAVLVNNNAGGESVN